MSDSAWFFTLVALGCLGLAAKVISAWRYHRRDLRDLMDTGDGQGGVPPLPRRGKRLATLGDYVTARQAAAGMVVDERMERLAQSCPGFCDNLAVIGEPEDCGCGQPCGRAWCTALRRQREAERGLA